MTRLVFAPSAFDDLEEIADYVAREKPDRALTFIAEIEAHCRRIAAQPEALPLREEVGRGIRMSIHGRYLIFFRQSGVDVRIERIIHGARRIAPVA